MSQLTNNYVGYISYTSDLDLKTKGWVVLTSLLSQMRRARLVLRISSNWPDFSFGFTFLKLIFNQCKSNYFRWTSLFGRQDRKRNDRPVSISKTDRRWYTGKSGPPMRQLPDVLKHRQWRNQCRPLRCTTTWISWQSINNFSQKWIIVNRWFNLKVDVYILRNVIEDIVKVIRSWKSAEEAIGIVSR